MKVELFLLATRVEIKCTSGNPLILRISQCELSISFIGYFNDQLHNEGYSTININAHNYKLCSYTPPANARSSNGVHLERSAINT